MLYFETQKTDVMNNAVQKCMDFLESPLFPKIGEKAFVDEKIYCVANQYMTVPKKSALWEAHIKYVDLHYILAGEEKICVAFTSQSETGAYHEEQDYLEIARGNTCAEINLKAGCALCLFPNDAHQVKQQVQEGTETMVTKVVFKIPIELF